MSKLSFRARIALCFCALLLVALFLPLRYYKGLIDEEILAESRERGARALDTVAWLMREHPQFSGLEEFNGWAATLGEKIDIRLTYIDREGRVLADSEVPYVRVPTMDNHAGRPEVREAVERGFGFSIRRSDTLSRDLVYSARPFDGGAGLPGGILRLAIPLSPILDRQERLAESFGVVLLATLALTVLLSMLLSGMLTRSVRRLASAAQAIGKGDLSLRISDFPGEEFRPLAASINAMAGSLEEQFRALENRRGELEALFDGMAEGVMVIGPDGRIQAWNRAMREIVPGMERFAGRTPLEALMAPEVQKAVERALGGEAPDPRPLRLESGERVLDVNLTSFRGHQGGASVVLVFHDVTRLHRLERMRRDFVANVSHELRTPITSIRGYAETLLETPPADAAARERFLSTILKNARHMGSIVDDLLRLARLEHRSELALLAPVDAGQAFERAAAMLGLKAKEFGVGIESVMPGGLKVIGQEEGVTEVFTNLLENAVRVSPAGAVVTVSAEAGEHEVVFSVRDCGPGIPASLREKIFERFFRIAPPDASALREKDGGSGLGLTICRHILAGFNGRIWAESPADGEGAVLRFSLPRAGGKR